jgi:hypothetical protein
MARYTVTLELSPVWVKITRSPLFMFVTALMGVSSTFAPLFLYWSGQGWFYAGFEWVVVPLCFVVVYCVPGFFFVLGQAVAKSLREAPAAGPVPDR